MKLCEILRMWRKMANLTLREASKDIGVSLPTLSRIERGEDCDGATLAKILTWQLAKKKA